MLFVIFKPSSFAFVDRNSVPLILICWCDVVERVNLVKRLDARMRYGD